MTHTDIKHLALPPALRPYAALARLDRPAGILLLLLPCLWGLTLASYNQNALPWGLIALFSLGAIIMRSAGCAINDIWDKDIDAQVQRTQTRPLASGAITTKQALAFLAALLTIGFIILLQLNTLTIALGILSLPLVITYPLMKRITWWPQAFLGLTFNMGALMGWSAVHGTIELPAILLYITGILWTLSYDTIYAHQDLQDDAIIGVKSSALKLGARAKPAITLFTLAQYACLAATLIITTHTLLSVLLCLPAFLHTLRLTQKWKPSTPQSALQTFKASTWSGALILLGLLAARFIF